MSENEIDDDMERSDEDSRYAPEDKDEQRRSFIVEQFRQVPYDAEDLVHLMDVVDKWLKDGTVTKKDGKVKPKVAVKSDDHKLQFFYWLRGL